MRGPYFQNSRKNLVKNFLLNSYEEMYPFAVIGTDERNKVELATHVYIGSTHFKGATPTVTLADRWVARQFQP